MKILVIDDQPTVCVPVAEKIERDVGRTFAGTKVVPLFTLLDAEDHLRKEPGPDLILLDLDLSESKGLETLVAFKALQARVSDDSTVAIFSGAHLHSPAGAALLRSALNDHDVKGIIPKNAQIDKMFVGLGRLLDGETWIPEDLMRSLLTMQPEKPALGMDTQFGLTKSEWKIAQLVADGLQNKEIARNLEVSHGHVRQVVTRVMEKMGVHNRTKVALAFQNSR